MALKVLTYGALKVENKDFKSQVLSLEKEIAKCYDRDAHKISCLLILSLLVCMINICNITEEVY